MRKITFFPSPWLSLRERTYFFFVKRLKEIEAAKYCCGSLQMWNLRKLLHGENRWFYPCKVSLFKSIRCANLPFLFFVEGRELWVRFLSSIRVLQARAMRSNRYFVTVLIEKNHLFFCLLNR